MAWRDLNHLDGTGRDLPFKKTQGADPFRQTMIEGEARTYTAYMPDKFLPTLRQRIRQNTTSDTFYYNGDPEYYHYIMPIGTVVSAYNIPSKIAGYNEGSGLTAGWGFNPINGPLTQFGIDANGDIVISLKDDGTPIRMNSDSHLYGYTENLMGLFTICNGDTAAAYDYYTTYDHDAEYLDAYGRLNEGVAFNATNAASGPGALGAPWNAVGTYRCNPDSGVALTRPALMRPAGIVVLDVLKDIDGRWLNYNQMYQKGYSIAYDAKIKIPFVMDNKLGGGLFGITGAVPLAVADYGVGYNAIAPGYQYLVIDAAGTNASFACPFGNNPGWNLNEMYVQADRFGKLRPMTGEQYTTNPWNKVGHLKGVDTRFPKDMMEYIDTMPDSKTQGTDTEGITQFMYLFAESILRANAAAILSAGGSFYKGATLPTRRDIREAIQAGLFGLAHINVKCGI